MTTEELMEKCREQQERITPLEDAMQACLDEYRTIGLTAWTATTMAALIRHALKERADVRS